jgi:heme A synthase
VWEIADDMKAAEFTAGLLLLSSAILAGTRLTRNASRERDPAKLLVLDLLLVGVVVLALAGAALLALPFTG